jgi:hypothetical protein
VPVKQNSRRFNLRGMQSPWMILPPEGGSHRILNGCLKAEATGF